MNTRTLLRAACAAAALIAHLAILSGCGSVGYQTRPPTCVTIGLTSPAKKIYLRSVEVEAPGSFGIYQIELDHVKEATQENRLGRALEKRAPDIFTRNDDGAPLDLVVSIQYDNNMAPRMGGAFLSGLSFGLIPFCMTSEYQFRVEPAPRRGPLNKLLARRTAEATVCRRGWGSIIPTGYIPCPQSSVLPRETISGPAAIEVYVSEAAKELIASQVAAAIMDLFAGIRQADFERAILLQSVAEQ